MFGTDSGTAIPLLNEIDIVGAGGITTSASGNVITITGTGGAETLTGNTGGPVSPLAANINTIGSGSIIVDGVPATHTLTAHLTGLTNHAVQVGAGTDTLTQVPGGSNGQVFLGATGADPAFANLTSTGGSVLFTLGPNALNLETSAATPDSFVTNSGIATPVAHVLNILGTTAAAGTSPLVTSGAGSTVTITSQRSQALAASDATKVGLSNFSSANFAVDANGFVTLAGTGGAAIQTITGNSGGAEVPSAGNFNILGTGSITIAGSANTETVQLTGLTNHAVLVGAGTATITKVGPTATTGQVLQSAGAAADPAFSTATYPLTTTINQLLFSSSANAVTGLTAANSAALVSTSAGVPVWSASLTNGQVILGSTGATPVAGTIGSSDSSITWTLGAGTLTGQVTAGTAVVKTITGNTGGALSPTAGNFNILGTGSITVAGSGSTETVQLTGLTNHAIQIGAGTAILTQLAATATTGQVLQNNASADPSYSTATYPSVATGTGTILRANGTNWVPTTATYPNTAGTSGNVLTSDGTNWNSTAPTQFNTVTAQRFTATGAFTYTPTSGMKYVIVELQGAGGGSGGIPATTATAAVSGSGGGGAYAKFILTAAQVGASLSGVVGTGGAGGAAGANAGSNGTATTLATTSAWTAGPGLLGVAGAIGTGPEAGGAGGTVTTGTGTILLTVNGSGGSVGLGQVTAGFSYAGNGGNSMLGIGGIGFAASTTSNTTNAGVAGVGFGAGGGGANAFGTNAGTNAGAAGTNGIAIFTEFLNV